MNLQLRGFFPSWSDMFDPGESACLARANNSPQVLQLDNLANDLAANWHPTGFYKASDILSVTDMLDNQLVQAGAALHDAPESTSNSEDQKRMVVDDGIRIVRNKAEGYIAAAKAAQTSGAAINAPGFKTYAIGAMTAISNVYVTATVLQCRQTWLEKWLDRALTVGRAIADVLRKIGGVIVAAGEAVINAVEVGASFIGTVIKVLPYAAIAIVAWVGYTWIRRGIDMGPSQTFAHVMDSSTRAAGHVKRAASHVRGRFSKQKQLTGTRRRR